MADSDSQCSQQAWATERAAWPGLLIQAGARGGLNSPWRLNSLENGLNSLNSLNSLVKMDLAQLVPYMHQAQYYVGDSATQRGQPK